MNSPRAYEALTREHLSRLAQAAQTDRDGLFRRRPHLAVFRIRILAVALCQGGALHYVDGVNGVKDLDVWTLYASQGESTYPARRVGKELECALPGLTGWSERVDLLGRSIPLPLGTDPAEAWRAYLGKPKTKTAQELRKKPVVLLEPAHRRGEVVWPA